MILDNLQIRQDYQQANTGKHRVRGWAGCFLFFQPLFFCAIYFVFLTMFFMVNVALVQVFVISFHENWMLYIFYLYRFVRCRKIRKVQLLMILNWEWNLNSCLIFEGKFDTWICVIVSLWYLCLKVHWLLFSWSRIWTILCNSGEDYCLYVPILRLLGHNLCLNYWSLSWLCNCI